MEILVSTFNIRTDPLVTKLCIESIFFQKVRYKITKKGLIRGGKNDFDYTGLQAMHRIVISLRTSDMEKLTFVTIAYDEDYYHQNNEANDCYTRNNENV